MKRLFAIALAASLTVLLLATASADPLIVMEGDTIKPGLAEKWEQKDDTTVVLTLKEDKAHEVKKQLDSALQGKATVKVIDKKTLEIKGIPQKFVYKELAAVDIKSSEAAVAANNDPFAALGGSGSIALEVPDGSSSLRARKKTDFSGIDAKNKDAVITGKVLKVKQSSKFPEVTLEILVLKAPKDKKLGIKKRSRITVYPSFGKLDVKDPTFKVNVGAWFLKKNDKVQIEIGGKAKKGYKALQVVRKR